MNCFKDKNGRQWTLEINIGTARRVKAECGVDLLNVVSFGRGGADTSGLQQITEDSYRLFEVIYSLCKPQIDAAKLDNDSFAELFDETAIENAVDALIREIINFSQPAKRKMLTLIYEKTRNFRAKTEQHLDELMESEEFSEELDSQLSELLTNTPE